MENVNQKKNIAIIAALVVIVSAFILGSSGLFSIGTLFGVQSASPVSPKSNDDGSLPLTDEFIIQEVTIGKGPAVENGDRVAVQYVGQFENGIVFDSSIESGVPFIFKLGTGEVIEGWDRGIVGMRQSGRRILVIPPELAYGSQGVGLIPPNATLFFDVTLISIEE